MLIDWQSDTVCRRTPIGLEPLKYSYFILNFLIIILVQTIEIQIPSVACICFEVLNIRIRTPNVFGLHAYSDAIVAVA